MKLVEKTIKYFIVVSKLHTIHPRHQQKIYTNVYIYINLLIFPEIQLLNTHQHTIVCPVSQLQTLWNRGKTLKSSKNIGPATRDHPLKERKLLCLVFLLMDRLPPYIKSPDTSMASILEDITV